jgi:hypothetical protein
MYLIFLTVTKLKIVLTEIGVDGVIRVHKKETQNGPSVEVNQIAGKPHSILKRG